MRLVRRMNIDMCNKIRYVIVILLLLSHDRVSADCLKFSFNPANKRTSAKQVALKKGKCPRGSIALSAISGSKGDKGDTGETGASGSDGADGKLALYGNGSAGALNISTNTSWSSSPPLGGNYQFTDCSISAGAVLTVQSGTVIRCLGTASIDGMINVQTGSTGGLFLVTSNTSVTSAFIFPPQGISLRGAGPGEIGPSGTARFGGIGGNGLLAGDVPNITSYTMKPGGAGMGRYIQSGGSGGGTFALLAKSGITISSSASITADGTTGVNTGCAGGGGGTVLLGTPGTITQNGAISAIGGAGRESGSLAGAGGGGGGGIIRLVAPTVTPANGGTLVVSGGAGGTVSGTVTGNPSSGGPGGGGSGGNGGGGADVDTLNVSESATNGSTGKTLITLADPTSIL